MEWFLSLSIKELEEYLQDDELNVVSEDDVIDAILKWLQASTRIRIRRIRIRIYLLARRNLLWDILRLPSSRRAALGLYVILTL